VLTSRTAYIDSTLALEVRASMRGRQKFHLGREKFFAQSYTIACTKGAPFRIAFNSLLSQMVESGLINKWKKEQLDKISSKTIESEPNPTEAITLAHLQGAFFVYALGCGSAALAFCAERLHSQRKRSGAPTASTLVKTLMNNQDL
ncbi:Ionotropic receptor 212, partial [Hyalella azteca]